MRNPFRSEAEAYRFLFGTLAYFGVIAVASLVGGTWWGLAAFVVVSIPAAVWLFHREAHVRPPASAPPHRGAEDERRILVVANETVAGTVLRKAVEAAAKDVRAQVLVVVPALNTKLKHWLSDEDGARSPPRSACRRASGRSSATGSRPAARSGMPTRSRRSRTHFAPSVPI